MPQIANSPDLELPLVEMLPRLHLSREQGLRLVYLGVLKGRKVEGRWMVDTRSAERFIREREQTSAGVPA